MADFITRLAGTPASQQNWALAISAAAALLLVTSPRAWRRTRIAITIAHEGGHALASLLTGRRLQGIRLHADTSGETVSRGRRSGPGIVATTLAGYPAPSLLGAGAAGLLAAHRVALLFTVLLMLLAVVLVAVRNWYGALAVAATVAAVFAADWFTGALARTAFGYGVAWFLLFGGVRPVMELARSRARRRRRVTGRHGALSDADQLAELTGVPGGAWVALFALITVGALALGARLLLPWPVSLPG